MLFSFYTELVEIPDEYPLAIGKFAEVCASVILFEVPTEKDKKGHKWTMDTGYSEALFVETAQDIFSSVEHMQGQTEHRPYYLCKV